MNVGDRESKLGKGSVQRNKAEKDADELRKLVSLAYPAFAAFLKAYEGEKRRARTARQLPAHLDRAIIAAESYPERDLLFRRLASYCYKTSQWFQKGKDYKQAVKWMNLALRFLRLSMDPKAKAMDEKFEAKLERLEQKMQELPRKEPSGAVNAT